MEGPQALGCERPKMDKETQLQFVGFTSNALGREYTFLVRELPVEPREFTVSIANEAFREHGLRFQDAPDICSLKLRRELLNGANLLPESHFNVTDAEVDDYRASHEAHRRNPFARRPPHRI
jgi:hypothetical protein